MSLVSLSSRPWSQPNEPSRAIGLAFITSTAILSPVLQCRTCPSNASTPISYIALVSGLPAVLQQECSATQQCRTPRLPPCTGPVETSRHHSSNPRAKQHKRSAPRACAASCSSRGPSGPRWPRRRSASCSRCSARQSCPSSLGAWSTPLRTRAGRATRGSGATRRPAPSSRSWSACRCSSRRCAPTSSTRRARRSSRGCAYCFSGACSRRRRPGSTPGRRAISCVEINQCVGCTLSSRRRVDGVEDYAMIQHERAVKF